jgi:hypothetical protein
MARLNRDPEFENLRGNSQWDALLEKLGLRSRRTAEGKEKGSDGG